MARVVLVKYCICIAVEFLQIAKFIIMRSCSGAAHTERSTLEAAFYILKRVLKHPLSFLDGTTEDNQVLTALAII